jgi:hypothetical protein
MSDPVLNLPLSAFQKYFNMTLPQYKVLSPTEQGVILSLVEHYPAKFRSQSVVKYVTVAAPASRPYMRKRMIMRSNNRKKKAVKKEEGRDFIILD